MHSWPSMAIPGKPCIVVHPINEFMPSVRVFIQAKTLMRAIDLPFGLCEAKGGGVRGLAREVSSQLLVPEVEAAPAKDWQGSPT